MEQQIKSSDNQNFHKLTPAEQELEKTNSKINTLNSESDKLKNLKVEMVIDLSPHQTETPDPNAEKSYYMTAGKNMNIPEKMAVNEKSIKGATNLGQMSSHHSSGADPTKFPSANKSTETPKKGKN